MAILKARPKVRVRIPNEIRTGESFQAMVLLDCKREVEVDFIRVHLTGKEWWRISSGKHSVSREQTLVSLGARLSERRVLPAGRTELPVTIPLPAYLPPSYDGAAGHIDYVLEVHVSVPWWPDRRAQFEIHVVRPPVPSPETAPRVYSSDPSGPIEREPHAELSLASTWTRAGGVVSGALALSNVEHNRYSEVKVGLLATELLSSGQRLHAKREPMRYRIRLGVEQVGEGEMIPFQFRIPEDAWPTLDRGPRPGGKTGLVTLAWELELVVGIRWSSDLTIKVPFLVLPASARPGDAPQRLAPPTVGSDRLRVLWTEVGASQGMTYDAQALYRRFGETELTVRREHLGRGGIHLVAELRYPELHLDLEVVPASGIKKLAGAGLRIGDPSWDRDHYVIARDEAQVGEVLRALVPLLDGPTLRRMDDTSLTLGWRDAGQSRGRLAPFLAGAVRLAERVESLRRALPPPPALAAALPIWETLAARVGGTLERARMRVRGQLTTLPAEVRVAFDEGGQPMQTWLTVESPTPLDAEHALRWRAGSDADPPHRGEAGELLRALVSDAAELAVEPARVALAVNGLLGVDPALDAGWAEQKLSRMARLIQVLRGEAGPYR